jgi:DNA-directed RNA polymerase specialized sigma24 family protein
VREPSAAADGLRDAFVVAAFRLADVPHESLLRPWLFAVARNECLRGIRGGTATAARSLFPDEDGQAPGDSPAEAPEAAGDPDEGRALPRAALGGLDAAERDFILMTWHGLDVAECADVLGVSRDEAFKLFSRAREQLEASAGVLVVAWSDWRECATFNAVMADWDGQLTPALRTELRAHIDHCDICADQRRQGLRPAVVLRMSPDAMCGLAIPPGTLRHAAWVTSRLKDQVLAAAFGQELGSFEHRAMAVRRASPFRDDGFPVPLNPPGTVRRDSQRSRAPLVLAVAAGTGLIVALAAMTIALSGQHSAGSNALPRKMSLSSPAVPSSGRLPSPGGGGPASPEASQSASPKATSSRTATPSASSSASGPPSKAAAFSVSPVSLTLARDQWGAYSGSITLSNPASAPVSWSVSLPPDLHPGSSASGTLAPGQSYQVSIIYYQHGGGNGNSNAVNGAGGHGPRTETVTVQPGNIQVAVTIPGRW